MLYLYDFQKKVARLSLGWTWHLCHDWDWLPSVFCSNWYM